MNFAIYTAAILTAALIGFTLTNGFIEALVLVSIAPVGMALTYAYTLLRSLPGLDRRKG